MNFQLANSYQSWALSSSSWGCAVELGIPTPSTAAAALRFLRRWPKEPVIYALTLLSRLLVSAPGAGPGLSPFALAMLQPVIVSPSMSLASWFRAVGGEGAVRVPFAGGRELWAVAKDDPGFGAAFNDAMACDGRFIMDLIVRGHGQYLFRGLASLVDVCCGSGGAAKAIAAAFPHVKCSVLDMFEHVPKADAVLLKI